MLNFNSQGLNWNKCLKSGVQLVHLRIKLKIKSEIKIKIKIDWILKIQNVMDCNKKNRTKLYIFEK
jgi:hypothetical protein